MYKNLAVVNIAGALIGAAVVGVSGISMPSGTVDVTPNTIAIYANKGVSLKVDGSLVKDNISEEVGVLGELNPAHSYIAYSYILNPNKNLYYTFPVGSVKLDLKTLKKEKSTNTTYLGGTFPGPTSQYMITISSQVPSDFVKNKELTLTDPIISIWDDTDHSFVSSTDFIFNLEGIKSHFTYSPWSRYIALGLGAILGAIFLEGAYSLFKVKKNPTKALANPTKGSGTLALVTSEYNEMQDWKYSNVIKPSYDLEDVSHITTNAHYIKMESLLLRLQDLLGHEPQGTASYRTLSRASKNAYREFESLKASLLTEDSHL